MTVPAVPIRPDGDGAVVKSVSRYVALLELSLLHSADRWHPLLAFDPGNQPFFEFRRPIVMTSPLKSSTDRGGMDIEDISSRMDCAHRAFHPVRNSLGGVIRIEFA